MSDVVISYNGSDIAEMSETGTKTLNTQGTYLPSNVQVRYTSPMDNANFVPGIESKTYETLLGGEFTVTTATDAEHEHPWVRTSITGFPNNYNCRYRITFDGTSYVVPAFALYSAHYEIMAGTAGYDECPCVGNISLFRLTYDYLFVEQQNVPFLLVYSDGSGTAYLDVYTETAGEHTVLVESETAEYSQIDPYLIYGMSNPPFDYRNRQLSIGTNGISSDNVAFAVGVGNTVTNNCSCAVGVRNDVNGMYSAAFGWFNKTGARYSFVAGGFGNEAPSNGAFASGQCTTAKGNFSHTEGNWTLTKGIFSHTEGDGGLNYARGAHVEGGGTYADASQTLTHIGGVNNAICTDTGKQVTITRRLSDGTLRSVWTGTLGKYAEVIGNGDSDDARSTARTLDWNGNEAIAGSLTLGLGTANEITLTPAQLRTVLASLLPSVSASDNGKVLQVVNGAWAAATIPSANGVNF